MLKETKENADSLALAHREAGELAQKVASLEGEVEDAGQARDTAEVNL
jgi:hypothetical protein